MFGLAFFLTTQLRFLNSGLAKHESIKIVPIYQTTIVVSGVLSGLIVWDEISVQTASSFVWFLVGLSLSCAGVLVLSFKPANTAGASSAATVSAAPVVSLRKNAYTRAPSLPSTSPSHGASVDAGSVVVQVPSTPAVHRPGSAES